MVIGNKNKDENIGTGTNGSIEISNAPKLLKQEKTKQLGVPLTIEQHEKLYDIMKYLRQGSLSRTIRIVIDDYHEMLVQGRLKG